MGPQGYHRSDERISEDAHERLTEDAWLDATNVSCSVSGGEVTLAGTVESREAKHRAERKGYADAMMLDWQGRVAECTGANIFFVQDGKIHTPIADCFLSGITRSTVIDLAKKRGFEVIERRIMPDELSSFSECFITGSAAEVTAVAEIAQWNFNPGGITKTLMEDYTAAVNTPPKAAAAA